MDPPGGGVVVVEQLAAAEAIDRFERLRFAWRGEFYLLEYLDRVALESFLQPLGVEVRWIRPGIAHLIAPSEALAAANALGGAGAAQAALDWFEGLLST